MKKIYLLILFVFSYLLSVYGVYIFDILLKIKLYQFDINNDLNSDQKIITPNNPKISSNIFNEIKRNSILSSSLFVKTTSCPCDWVTT